jgi:glycosyltransferase involved in cell wall biosynthesis
VRILFVTNMYPSPERPGYGAFVWQQAEQLQHLGHDVDVVDIPGFRSKIHYLKGAVDVVRKTRQTAYDIVHAHYGLAAFPAWFRLRSPLIITLHGSDVLGTKPQMYLSRLICRFADSVIVVSEEIQKRIPGVVIPCGVDLQIFRPLDRQSARARLGLPQHKCLILFPFDPARRVKRYDLARAAVEQLKAEGLNAELMTVSMARNTEMPWYYSAADAMLLCSDREGSPTSVKEALACNLPVVATDVGDLRDVMRDVVGSRICTANVADIARGLRDTIAASRNGGFHGRAAMARYDQVQTINQILNVYSGVLLARQSRCDA